MFLCLEKYLTTYHLKPNMFVNAESYERFMGRWSRVVASRFVDLIDVPDGGQILDVGSGTGSLAFTIAQEKPKSRIVGIDTSQEYVAYANSRNPSPGRIGFEICDAEQMRFADGAFRACLSLLVFNFIPDPLNVLRQLYRVTESRGLIAAAVWDYGGEMRMLRTFWDAASSIDATAKNRHEALMPLCRFGELSELWKAGGLENIQERPLDITLRFESFEDYWSPFLLGQGPAGAYVTHLSPEGLQTLRNQVKRRLSLSAEDVSFVLPARAWAVRGTVPGIVNRYL
jgi:SAM-dependent methyltransferase